MIRISYRRDGEKWVGLLRSGTTIITECGHTHTNRDVTTGPGGEAAQVCARMIRDGARNPATAEHRATRLRTAWIALTTNTGFQTPAGTIEKARAYCTRNAADYLARVDQVRAHPDLNTAAPATPAAAPQDETGDMPDWML